MQEIIGVSDEPWAEGTARCMDEALDGLTFPCLTGMEVQFWFFTPLV